jgi:hypothetical protein
VSILALDAPQTGTLQYALLNCMPLSANRLIFGDLIFEYPYEKSSGRKSSMYNNKMLGLFCDFWTEFSEHANKINTQKIILDIR